MAKRSSRRGSLSPSTFDAFAAPAGAGGVDAPPPTLAKQMLDMLVGKFKGEDAGDAESAKLADLRKQCREGNPFPLIAMQWPELVLADPAEIELFATPMNPDRLHSLTDSIVKAIADPMNPPLRIDAWQKIIIAAYFDSTVGEVYIKGCTGAGKGMAISLAFCLWYDAYEESRVTLTGRDYSHAVVNIFGEVKKWFMRMRHPFPSKVLGEGISDTQRHYVRILNPDPTSPTAGEAFSGAHGPNTAYGFDEACHDDETEVLSKRGWIFFCDFVQGDELLSMNPESREVFYQRPASIHFWPRRGSMYLYQCKAADFCVTPDHRMLCYPSDGGRPYLATIESLDGRSPVGFSRGIEDWTGEEVAVHVIDELEGPQRTWPERSIPMDEWLEFLGWYLSEGNLIYRSKPKRTAYGAVVTQKKYTKVLPKLKAFAESWGFKANIKDYRGKATPQLVICCRQLGEHLFPLGTNAICKKLPDYLRFLSKRQIAIFVDAFLQGDGTYKATADVFYTSSPWLANGIHELCIKLGYQAAVTNRKMKGVSSTFNGRVLTSKHDGFSIRRSRLKEMGYDHQKVKVIDYDGMVWCAHLPPCHVMLTRRNGKCLWSGNTSHPDEFIENAEKNARKIVAAANPRTLLGRFRNAFGPLKENIDKIGVVQGTLNRRLCVTVGGMDCANVRFGRLKQPVAPLGGIEIDGRQFSEGDSIPPEFHALVKPLIPEQIDLGQFRGICSKPDSRQVDVFAHGKFPTEDPQKQVILSSWLARHEAAWIEMQKRNSLPPPEAFSLDVARSLDGDSTAFTAGGQSGIAGIHLWKYNDTTFHVAEVLRLASQVYGVDLRLGRHPVCVDMDGLGAGVGDQLRLLGVWVIEFRGNARSEVDPRTYVNLRAEAYGTLGRRLNPADRWGNTPWAIPTDESLRRELVAPEKVFGNDFLRWKVLPKEEIKKLLSGSSPDTGDAVVYLFHAVRTLHNLNAYFAASAAPLTVYPFPPDPRPGDTPGYPSNEPRKLTEAEELLARLQAEYGGTSNVDRAGQAGQVGQQGVAYQPPADPAKELLDYLHGYGGGGNSGGGGERRDWRSAADDE